MKSYLLNTFAAALLICSNVLTATAQQTETWTTGVTGNNQAELFYWVGATTPSSATKYTLSSISFTLASGGKATESHLAICTAATASSTVSSIPAAEVVGVSDDAYLPSATPDAHTYTFSTPVELEGNTRYYFCWVSSATPSDGYYTSTGQRLRVQTGETYTDETLCGTTVRTIWAPVFTAELSYGEGDENQTKTFTVTTLPACDATFSWNGQTIVGTSATFSYEGEAVTGEEANVTITPTAYYTLRYPSQTISWDGQDNASNEVKMLADVFGTSYGEKWVRIDNAALPAYSWHISAASDYEGSTPVRTAFTSEDDLGFLFCFVGTPESFRIYSKLAGEGYALTTDGTNSNDATNATALYLTSDVSNAKMWTIDDTYLTSAASSPGFVIHDTDADGLYGANPFAKYDYALRYWNAEGPQSHWLLQPCSSDDLFSGHYGEKWLQLTFSRDKSYHWSVASTTDVPKCTNNATPLDGNLWCFVGTSERFKVYNKLVGQSKALTSSNVSSGSYVSLATEAVADFWTIGDIRSVTDNNQTDGSNKTEGYPIYSFGNEAQALSLNAYRGKGNQLAYYSWNDGGSLWLPELYEPEELDIYSSYYGEKWVRITYGASNKYCLMVTPKETLTYDGAMVRNGRTDMTHEGQLWCFVGTAEGFTLYNRVAGSQYAAATGTSLNGTKPLVLVPVTNAETFVVQNNVCLSSTSDLSTGVAPIGSNGSPAGAEYKVGFLSSSNSKCSYLFEEIGASVNLAVAGITDALPATHDHIARGAVTFPIGSTTRQMSFNVTPTQHTLFLPKHGSLSFAKPTCWIGFTFDGYDTDGVTLQQTLSGVNSETDVVTLHFTESNSEVRYIAYDGDERDIPYRIPSIARAKNGDLIAIYDLRYNEADIGYYDRGFYHYRIDLVMKVSKDNGVTWSDEYPVLTGDNSGRFTAAFGDAALVADRDRNLLMMLCAAGNTGFASAVKMSRVYLQLNEATGEWEIGTLNADGTFVQGEPEDITDYMLALTSKGGLSTGVYSAFCGSGRISQSRIYKRDNYYRIYFTAIVKSSNTDGTWGNNGNITYYSDDFGQTWNILGERAAFVNSDEPKCDELPNGDVWMSGRAANGRNFNIYHFTDIATGEGTWLNRVHTQNSSVTNGIYSSDNACNGDIILVKAQRASDGQPVTLALASIPAHSTFTDPVWSANGRRNVSIFYKALINDSDYATTEALASDWEGRDENTAFLVSDHMSAYSSMCLMADGRIGFFLEDDVVTGTAPWSHFDMCFIPFSIATITGGKYTDGYNLSVDATGLSTMFLDYPVQIPNSAIAYTANSETGSGIVAITPTEGIIPAETGVLVSTEGECTLHMIEAYTWPEAYENNRLTGYFPADKITSASDSDYYYALYEKEGKSGFFAPEDASPAQPNAMTFTMNARAAYLLLDAPLTSLTGLDLAFDKVTNINQTLSNTTDQPRIYDLQGRRAYKVGQQGVYVVNGKLVSVK